MFSLLLLGSLAEMPPFPERGEPIENECSQAYPLAPEAAPPEDLIDPGTWTVACSSVAVPTSQVAHLLETHAWAEGMVDIYALDIQILQEQVELKQRRAWKTWVQAGLFGLSVGMVATVVLYEVKSQ